MVEYPQSGSIIYINFDPSIGAEIQKRRPAVVISNDILAKTSPFAWVVPISHDSRRLSITRSTGCKDSS